jgi:NADPH2:quinone reductase
MPCPLLNIPIAALGARVIAAAGSSTKLDIAKRYGGADYVVNYTKPQWQKEVMKITGGHGADVIYDPVGIITGISRHP